MNVAKLLLIHAIVTFAAGVVLLVAPDLIPRTVGIRVDSGVYLVCYLLGTSEMGLATLSYSSRTLKDAQGLRVVSPPLHRASRLDGCRGSQCILAGCESDHLGQHSASHPCGDVVSVLRLVQNSSQQECGIALRLRCRTRPSLQKRGENAPQPKRSHGRYSHRGAHS